MKTILITGNKGMIGRELFLLLRNKRYKITTADLKDGYDLTDFNTCLKLCNGIDEVYHLAGIKGNPKRTKERPIDFMGPMIRFDTNMILAAQKMGVKKFLYTSSIAVLNPEMDKYPAWAKKTAETLIEAMRIQYPEIKYCIIRPSNVYGKFDDLKAEHLMVVSDLIRKSLKNKTIEVWGDGTQIRDFINSKDVAKAMIKCMRVMPEIPINCGSGEGHSVNEIVQAIDEIYPLNIFYKKDAPIGDKIRLMPTNLELINFKPTCNFKKEIQKIWRFKKKTFKQ